jgi:hypothetical protein
MRILLIVTTLMLSFALQAQNYMFYVAAKTGLSIREKPEAGARVLDKIPYGTRITLLQQEEERVKIITEGMEGYWARVTYNNKTGYIVSSYLFPWAPPKGALVKEMKDYFKQVTVPFGALLKVKSGERRFDDSGWEIQKQFYKNGAEWHKHLGWEYSSNAYMLPGFGLEQGFLLMRLLPEFKDVFGEKDEFPTANKTFTKGEIEYRFTVTKNSMGEFSWVEKIRLEYEEGASYFMEMFMLDNQLVIIYGGGL